MIKLIKLELKKIKFRGYIIRAISTSFVVTALLFAMLYTDRNEMVTSSSDFLFTIDSIFRIVFVIFSGVLISRLIIDEYHDKTITLMFTYPISRKKIMASKLFIIMAFAFFSILLSRIFATFVLSILNSHFSFVTGKITIELIIEHFKHSILYDLATGVISLVPLYFGMLKKSVKTTIVASIIVAALLGGNIGGLQLGSFIAVPLLFTMAGIVIAYLSIRNIEQNDLN